MTPVTPARELTPAQIEVLATSILSPTGIDPDDGFPDWLVARWPAAARVPDGYIVAKPLDGEWLAADLTATGVTRYEARIGGHPRGAAILRTVVDAMALEAVR